MGKKTLWLIMGILVLIIVPMILYADHYGNLEIQKVALDLLKVSVGAVLGAWANEMTK